MLEWLLWLFVENEGELINIAAVAAADWTGGCGDPMIVPDINGVDGVGMEGDMNDNFEEYPLYGDVGGWLWRSYNGDYFLYYYNIDTGFLFLLLMGFGGVAI